jgi:hypothetical protein
MTNRNRRNETHTNVITNSFNHPNDLSYFVCRITSNLFQCLIHYIDTFIDLMLCYEYYLSGNLVGFVLTVFFFILPNTIILILSTAFKLFENSNEHKWRVAGEPEAIFLMKQIFVIFVCSVFNLFVLLGYFKFNLHFALNIMHSNLKYVYLGIFTGFIIFVN